MLSSTARNQNLPISYTKDKKWSATLLNQSCLKNLKTKKKNWSIAAIIRNPAIEIYEEYELSFCQWIPPSIWAFTLLLYCCSDSRTNNPRNHHSYLGWFFPWSIQDLFLLLDLWLWLSLLRFLSLLWLPFSFSCFTLLDFTLIRPPMGIFPPLFCKTVSKPDSPSMANCWSNSGVKVASAFDFMSSYPVTIIENMSYENRRWKQAKMGFEVGIFHKR